MAYRDDVTALEARLAALTADVAVRVRERDQAARLLDEARARAHAEAYLADLAAGGPTKRRHKRIRIAALVAGLAMITGAVFALRHSHRDDRFERAMEKFEHFTGEMCQCEDSACATHVSDEMTKWSTEIAKEWQPFPKLTEPQIKLATELGERMAKCMTKAMTPSDPQPGDVQEQLAQ